MPDQVFGFEKPEDSPGFLLWQTTITWQRKIKRALDPYGIIHAQFVILAILLWFEQIKQQPTQVIISNWSKLDKMTVSKSLKTLAAKNYVTRVEHIRDSRAKGVYLTSAGRELVTQLVPVVEGIDEQFFSVVNQNDQQELIKILHGLISGR